MGKRLSIGVSQDTGIRIYRNYIGRTDIKYEYAIPVFKPADLGINIKHLAMERFLPDRYCFVPKRRGYFTDGGFADSGFPDVVSMGCEEYMWQGDPFAFHVRGRYNELKNDRRLLTDVVMSFSDLVPPKSPISSCESVEFPAC